jgi:hypothetical protein
MPSTYTTPLHCLDDPQPQDHRERAAATNRTYEETSVFRKRPCPQLDDRMLSNHSITLDRALPCGIPAESFALKSKFFDRRSINR